MLLLMEALNDDDKIGIIDTTYFCIMKSEEEELQLYKYKDNTNYFDQHKKQAVEMADYAKSTMQVYQNMILNGETTLDNKLLKK